MADDPAAFGNETYLQRLKRIASVPRRVGEGMLSSLASLPQRAIENSQYALESGNYDPGPTLEAAMLPMGTGAVAGVPVRAGEAALGAGPIRAYHSSPYDFERFDLSKIGSGEGAQVYGHGLYFAENPAVSGQGGQYWQQFLRKFPESEQHAADRLRTAGFDRGAAVKNVEQDIADWKEKIASLTANKDTGYYRERAWAHRDDLKHAQDRLAFREAERDALLRGGPVGPRTYEVNINADPAHMLDWDRPLRDQPHVQDVLADRMLSQLPGKAGIRALRNVNEEVDALGGKAGDILYRNFSTRPREVSAILNEAGIPGIRYLDQGSRNAQPILKTTPAGDIISSHYPPPTSNYVMFDPSLIDIVKKYGLAGLGGAPVLAGSLRDKGNQP